MVSAAVGLPPCCAGCAEHDREDGVCRLLADPTFEHRQKLATMPCAPEQLLERRLRAHGPAVAREALALWLDPTLDPEEISLAYGKTPRDARLWLSSFPYVQLGRESVRHPPPGTDLRSRPPPPPGPEDEAKPSDPGLALRMARALERVRQIDAVGYAMLLDFLRNRFDREAWAVALGTPSVSGRLLLAVYRYVVCFHEVLSLMATPGPLAALSARRFSPGDPDDEAALEATRAALRAPDLPPHVYASLYREGAEHTLALLAAPDALGDEAMRDLDAPLRHALGLVAGPAGDAEDDWEEGVRRRLAAPLAGLGTPKMSSTAGKSGAEHPDPELVATHAAGELTPEYSLALTRHMLACEDGRCPAITRDAIAGAALVRDALYGLRDALYGLRDEGTVEEAQAPTEVPPAPAPEAWTAHTFTCDDELWEAFEEMAREAGRAVDELLDEAMRAYARLPG